MEKLNDIIFYSIDKAIRSYRQYAQMQLREAGFKMTIDQWLIMKNIMENPGISQQDIGERVFKDNASVTRMIDLLVKSKFLARRISAEDRRRSVLELTVEGKKNIAAMQKVILNNRNTALNGIGKNQLEVAREVMNQIIFNTQKDQ